MSILQQKNSSKSDEKNKKIQIILRNTLKKFIKNAINNKHSMYKNRETLLNDT
jgi:hypothetical protein